ncbi:SGNH hydrolase domain-containing protein [Parvibaculum sedimenti]|uniref:SGNH hydrolase domain-containing protein n=1 Tax=Parvibaculum sedimenti TaxID=2608632 RepID=UPI003CCD6735
MQRAGGGGEGLRLSEAAFQIRSRDATRILDAIPDAPNLHRIRPAELLCNKGSCLIYKADKSLYADDDHLSKAGAEFLSPLFAPVFATQR